MMPTQSPKLEQLEEHFIGLLKLARQREVCKWCRDPFVPVAKKGLCASCGYREKEWCTLQKRVNELPPESPTEQNSISKIRRELEIAKHAVDQCKDDGTIRQGHFEQTTALDLERMFVELSRRASGKNKDLFKGKKFLFDGFSPLQRIWLGYLISPLIDELRRKRRLEMANSTQKQIEKHRRTANQEVE